MPFQILFAGAGGCGKSPVANYLSWKFNLPRVENDSLRNEVKEDMLDDLSNQEVLAEYRKRLKERYDELNRLGWSFVDDCSIDRTWFTRDEWFDKKREPFIISFDLSAEFILRSYKAKHYDASSSMLNHLPRWVEEHQKFLDHFEMDVGLHITEDNFDKRIVLAEEAVRKFISQLGDK